MGPVAYVQRDLPSEVEIIHFADWLAVAARGGKGTVFVWAPLSLYRLGSFESAGGQS